MIVADTDVLIDFLRDARPMSNRIELELKAGMIATTTVTAFELLSGARTDRQLKAVQSLLKALTVLPLGPQEARLAAQIRLTLEARGEGIGMADYLIAGICLSRRAMILTRNRKHFGRVPELMLAADTTANT